MRYPNNAWTRIDFIMLKTEVVRVVRISQVTALPLFIPEVTWEAHILVDMCVDT